MTPEISASLQQFATQILLLVISIGLPILVAGIIYLGRYIIAFVKAKVAESESKRDDLIFMALEQAAGVFVKAAKQSGLSGAIADEGKAKKAYAIELLKNYALSQGWDKLDIGTLDAALEAAVRDGVQNGFGAALALPGEPLATLETVYTADTNLSEETAQSLITELVRQRTTTPATGGYVGGIDLVNGSRELTPTEVAAYKAIHADSPALAAYEGQGSLGRRISALGSREMSQVFASPTAPDAE